MLKGSKRHKLFFIFLIPILLSVGCTTSQEEIQVDVIDNPDAAEILEFDPDADILQYEGVIYQTGVDWVDELDLTKGEQVEEITEQNDSGADFEDNMANKLPVGTKVYESAEKEALILLAEVDGELIRYYGLVEG